MTRRNSLVVLAGFLFGFAACSGGDTSGSEGDATELDVQEVESAVEDSESDETAGFDADGEGPGAVLTEVALPSCDDAPADVDCRSIDVPEVAEPDVSLFALPAAIDPIRE